MLRIARYFLLIVLMPEIALAAVKEETAARLETDLTPVGAERAGNGSDIPAWSGGLPVDKGPWPDGFHTDPYASDLPVLVINASNMEQYSQRLSAGQQALLQRFPDLYLNIYPTHRSASYPDYVYQAVHQNALGAQLLPFGSGVTGAVMSSPFPVPDNALEVIWNHTLRFRGQTVSYRSVSSLVTENGDHMDTLREYRYFFKYSETGMTPDKLDNTVFFLTRETLSPPQQAGTMTLVHEPLDQISSPRKSWIYIPGQRRLRRTPDLAYDTPDPNTQSLRTIDQVDMFNGSPDHYDWSLIGKQELYIPYNAYPLHRGGIAIDKILQPHHLNPALLRYEAHRVWVIEARLRESVRHKYQHRRYYLDEDSWQIVYAEEYDSHGQLQQISEAHVINYYDVPLIMSTLEVTYDLSSGQYYVEGLDNEQKSSFDFFDSDIRESDFSTSAVRRDSKR
jgi:hypothetical protein